MATMLLEPFARELIGGKEPNEHQLQFLYLPLPIFRKFTNVESIATDNYIKDHAKQPTKREINEMIENCHRQMGQLNKWGRWNLGKLKFRLPNSNTDDAQIIDFEDERQMDEDRLLSSHQKQFVYLPLSILESASNIRQLFSDTVKGKKLDALIRKIHSQMPSKDWAPELDRLRFIDTSNDDRNANEKDNIEATVAKPMRRTTRLASMRVTAMQSATNIEPTTRQLRKRKWQPNNVVENSTNLVPGKAKSVQSKKSQVISGDSSTESQPANGAMDDEHVHSDAANETVVNEKPSTSAKSSEILDHLDNEMAQLADTQQYDASKQRELYSPSDFQCEIEQLNFEDFVNKTNIKQIVQREYRKQNKDADGSLSDDDMDSRLIFFYNFRTKTTEWHRNGIKNLKFIECESVPELDFSKVNHDENDESIVQKETMVSVQDVGVQYDLIVTIDKSTSTFDLSKTIKLNAADDQETNGQCDSVEGSINETAKPIQDSQPHTLCQSKSNTAMTTQTQPQPAALLIESPPPKANGNAFDSPCPRSIEIPNDDDTTEDQVVDEQAETVDDDSLSIVPDSEAGEEEEFSDDEISNQSTGSVNYNPVQLDASEYDIDLPQTIQLNASNQQETNDQCADGGVNSNELNPLQDVVGLPSQSNENESQVIGSEIIANAHIVASNLPDIKQESSVAVPSDNITQFLQADAAQEKDEQNVSESGELPNVAKHEEDSEDFSDMSFETIDGSLDFPSINELLELDEQETEETQSAPAISSHEELLGILSGYLA